MGARDNLQRLAYRKQQEIQGLRTQIERAEIYLQAIQDSIKALPREPQSKGTDEPIELRSGTLLAKARDAIIAAGKPLHINELVVAVGKPLDKKSKLALAGSIAAYVRKRQVFTRPAANTFGVQDGAEAEDSDSPPLPEDFGS
jgi:hypothetical protein